jgi:hypothetical protein
VQLSGGEIFAHNPAVDQKPKQRTRIARGLRLNQDLGRRIHFAPSNLANDESKRSADQRAGPDFVYLFHRIRAAAWTVAADLGLPD